MNINQNIYYTKHKNLNKIDSKKLQLQFLPEMMKFSQALDISRNEPLLIAKKGNNVMAYASLELHPNTIEIFLLEVVPKHRKKGVGKAVLQRISKLAKNKNKSKVILFSTPAAKNYYKSQGFQSQKDRNHKMYKMV